jgi:enoyl-CoA hydratase/carnithine racemase
VSDIAADFTTIDVVGAGSRGALTLNRPDKLNPLSSTTLAEIAEAARWFDRHPAIKVVVVSGNGRSFSAGADLGAFDPAGPAAPADRSPRENADLGRLMADAVEGMSAITVARIHGHCIGGGVVLAAACDLRVAASDAYFSIPEVDLGIPLAWGGIPRLVREIGPALTKELVMTCRPFTAEEARAAGFVNRVVAPDLLDQEVEELVAQLLTKSSLTLKATKRHVDAVTRSMISLDRSWADADSLVAALRDPESRESAAAYLQRVRKK